MRISGVHLAAETVETASVRVASVVETPIMDSIVGKNRKLCCTNWMSYDCYPFSNTTSSMTPSIYGLIYCSSTFCGYFIRSNLARQLESMSQCGVECQV